MLTVFLFSILGFCTTIEAQVRRGEFTAVQMGTKEALTTLKSHDERLGDVSSQLKRVSASYSSATDYEEIKKLERRVKYLERINYKHRKAARENVAFSKEMLDELRSASKKIAALEEAVHSLRVLAEDSSRRLTKTKTELSRAKKKIAMLESSVKVEHLPDQAKRDFLFKKLSLAEKEIGFLRKKVENFGEMQKLITRAGRLDVIFSSFKSEDETYKVLTENVELSSTKWTNLVRSLKSESEADISDTEAFVEILKHKILEIPDGAKYMHIPQKRENIHHFQIKTGSGFLLGRRTIEERDGINTATLNIDIQHFEKRNRSWWLVSELGAFKFMDENDIFICGISEFFGVGFNVGKTDDVIGMIGVRASFVFGKNEQDHYGFFLAEWQEDILKFKPFVFSFYGGIGVSMIPDLEHTWTKIESSSEKNTMDHLNSAYSVEIGGKKRPKTHIAGRGGLNIGLQF
ncbi:MAG: hypothetical protein HOE80_02825 [Candidatus Magasanikbacteria bacterium]|nr:hypothetical protein [Candidatus Magasanikbacteria bacterium]MBT4071632.1 hypothetical protein [Candidatus Magasanikbacteria bacterium]